jgi:hypothetical protein
MAVSRSVWQDLPTPSGPISATISPRDRANPLSLPLTPQEADSAFIAAPHSHAGSPLMTVAAYRTPGLACNSGQRIFL